MRALRRPGSLFFASTHLYDGDFYPGSGKDSAAARCTRPLPWVHKTHGPRARGVLNWGPGHFKALYRHLPCFPG